MAVLSSAGHSVTRVDAAAKVTGEAEFPGDVRREGMLHGKVVRSPHAHARILEIDTTAAMKVPGVAAIVTALDTPPVPISHPYPDRYLFPPDRIVRYVGDAVAAVAADTEDTAEKAAALIKVRYEELPAVIDVEEAYAVDPKVIIHPNIAEYHARSAQAGAPLLRDPQRPNVFRHFPIRKGDAARGFDEADFIVEDRYETPRIHHSQLETCVSVAWFEPDGTLRVRTASQGVTGTRQLLCVAFNLPPEKVIVDCPYLGGGFGGKGRNITSPYAAFLARKTGKPVRVSLTRAEHFHCGRSRIGLVTYLKDGVKKDGTIVSRQVTMLVNGGAYAESAVTIARNCAFGAVGIYNIANFRLDAYGIHTNTPMAGAFRGFGSAEVGWAIENQMDVIAEKLGMDPLALRRKNTLRDGDYDACGQLVRGMGLPQCIDEVQGWLARDEATPTLPGNWRRGKGIALANKFTHSGAPSAAVVRVLADGSVEVRHSSHEIGMGVDTVAAQVAAETFGIKMSDVTVLSGNTGLCPPGAGPFSSRETFHVGNAVLGASADAKKQLCRMGAPFLNAAEDELEVRNKKVFVIAQPDRSIAIRELLNPIGADTARGE
ncbi:MAG: xanthine dehydrogenase family protein molybdopterin-binding subunit, partial [Chloroflexota bacterium]